MSYIRASSIFKFVRGESSDYVYPTSYKKGKKEIDYIEDYGGISDAGIIEMLFRYQTKEEDFNKKDVLIVHLLKRLAENLNVKLRKKPLTDKQEMREFNKRLNKFSKDEKLGGKIKWMKRK